MNTTAIPPQTSVSPQPPSSSSTTATSSSSSAPAASMESTATIEAVHLRPPSKLPSRPRKVRRLSPEKPTPTPTTEDSSKSVAVTTLATKPCPCPRPRFISLAPPIRSLSSEGEVESALAHLRSVDPNLAKVIDSHHPPTFDCFQTPFLALTKSILYQQLAYKAGSSIYSRFVSICGGESGVSPETLLALTPQQLRQIGVSGRKTSYLHDLARKYQNGILSDSTIINMDDKSLFTMLTMVNGIGSWSVHMFMIFSLHRPDVLPVNDLGVRKGVQMLYGLEDLPRPSQMEQLCDKWRPYRSVACWYIWRFLDAQGVPASSAVITAPPAANATSTHQHHQQQEEEVLSLPSPHQQSSHQPSEHQQQFIDPINGIINLGQLS